MKIRFLSSMAILLALIRPAWADEGAELILDPLVLAEADEDAERIRDPFWPVGYGLEVQTSAVAVVTAEVTPELQPVSQEEWDKARAKLPRADGIFIGSHPVTKEKVEKMMIRGKVYYAGDSFCQTNEFVAFTWKVDSISFKSTKYELSPVTAERVVKESK